MEELDGNGGVKSTFSESKENSRRSDERSLELKETRAQLPSALMSDDALLSGSVVYPTSFSLAFEYAKLVDRSATVVVAAIAVLSFPGVHENPSTHLQPQPHHIECNDKHYPTNHSKSASTCIVYRLGGICAENLTVPA